MRILLKDDYKDFEKIFELLKKGFRLSLLVVKDFEEKDNYILFAEKGE